MRTYTFAFWSENVGSWVSYVVTGSRELAVTMSERLALFTGLPVRVVETASADDDAIERALQIEPVPEDVDFAESVHPPGDPNR